MKNIIIKLLLCCLVLSVTPQAIHAQFGSLKNRVKNRINNKIENKIDKAVDDVLDGKSNKRTQSDAPKRQTESQTQKNRRSETRSQETSTDNNNQESAKLLYEYNAVIRDCAEFLDYQSGAGLRGLGSNEEQIASREAMTAAYIKKNISTDRNSRDNYSTALIECYENLKTPGLHDAIYADADEAYMRFDKEDALDRLKALSRDLAFINRVIAPEDEKLKSSTAYVVKLRDKLAKKNDAAMDKIACSPFHKQNMNKIFFTSNPNINPVTATASDFKTSFKAGEDIYGVAYFSYKIQKDIDGTGRIRSGSIGAKNGEGSGTYTVDYQGNFDKQKTYAVFVIYADASRYKNKSGSSFPTVSLNAEFLSKLPPRNHTIVAKVGDDAEGSFQFDANNDTKLESMAATAKTLRARIVSNKKMPKAGMKNATYERQLVSLFNGMGWSEKFKKAVITSKEYGYKRVAGRITGRTLSVLMFSKKSDGTCMYQDFTVIQPKTAGGYGSFRRLSTGGQSDIGCDKF